jgi:hypothetical protein
MELSVKYWEFRFLQISNQLPTTFDRVLVSNLLNLLLLLTAPHLD